MSADEEVEQTPNYSEKLKLLLTSKNVWHRFIEFTEPVKTVEQAESFRWRR